MWSPAFFSLCHKNNMPHTVAAPLAWVLEMNTAWHVAKIDPQ